MQARFLFDNATSDASFSDNALRANRMNLSPGVKCPPMRSITWGDGFHQEMTFPQYADKNLRGKPKGIRIIIEGRGLWRAGLTLYCRGKCPPMLQKCCVRKFIANQPDFPQQKCVLEELIVSSGQMIIFYSKLHCELSFIDNFWGAAKRYARKNCNYI